MTPLQSRIIILCLSFLVLALGVTFQFVFYYLGKWTWEHFFLKKLKRTSKLRFHFFEIKHRDGPEMIYVLTGIADTFLFLLAISFVI
jgi:hypothetical protein